MAWPELPDPDKPVLTPREEARWNALDDRSKQSIEAQRAFNKRETSKDIGADDPNQIGEFWGNTESAFGDGW
jgi:hypothetical protein